MGNTNYALTDIEETKFIQFRDKHIECSNTESLSQLYNVKLVFNISRNSVLPTCLCSVCDEEDLLADRTRYEVNE